MSARVEQLTRREAILRVSALLGGAALVGQSALLASCATGGSSARRSTAAELFTQSDLALLDEVADTILPATSTPGAKAAAVGPFIATMVADVYDAREQRTFRDGLVTLEREGMALNGVPFLQASAAQRVALLEKLDREQFDYMRARPETPVPHYFRMIKELSLLGYFTSEIGYTRAMRYTEVPGRFDPCVTLAPGDTSWASHA
jgi:hypothetical protein